HSERIERGEHVVAHQPERVRTGTVAGTVSPQHDRPAGCRRRSRTRGPRGDGRCPPPEYAGTPPGQSPPDARRAESSVLAYDLGGLLVGAATEVGRMPKMPGVRPLAEPELDDRRRFDPG